MVKVYGPAMSLDASGSLAKTIVFSKWKGRNYVRERVIPTNPKSGAQTGRRAMFKFLAQQWDGLATADKASWQDLADQLVASRFNGFVRQGMRDWHNFLYPATVTPALRVWLPSDNALTDASWEENRIVLTFEGTVLNNGWGKAVFAVAGVGDPGEVAECIIVHRETSSDAHELYWTPPTVGVYTFNSRTFAYDGAQAAAYGGPQTATP